MPGSASASRVHSQYVLREDLEAKGPVRVSEVEAQQKEILKIVRRLSDEGQLSIGGKGDEAYV